MEAAPDEAGPRRPRALAALWTALGALFVALGVAGVVLPLVPTTPFLLLAGACFLRGSPRLHRRLHESRLFGPYLVQWEVEHTVPPRAKVKALFLVVVTFSISVAVVDRALVRGVLVVLGSVLLLFLANLRTAPPLAGRAPERAEPRGPRPIDSAPPTERASAPGPSPRATRRES